MKSEIIESASKADLMDQTFSNMIYGLSLLGLQWEFMDADLKNSITRALATDRTFSLKVSQHVANTIWVGYPNLPSCVDIRIGFGKDGRFLAEHPPISNLQGIYR